MMMMMMMMMMIIIIIIIIIISRCMYCSRGVQFRCRNDSGQVKETETLHMG